MCINSFLIKIFSDYIGEDKLGNKYYTHKNKRMVVYKGLKEPSKVPPMWHAWLHHLSDKIPSHDDLEGYDWQKDYMPNLTGTENCYKQTRIPVSSDYEPWKQR